jgi:hypothetical protein
LETLKKIGSIFVAVFSFIAAIWFFFFRVSDKELVEQNTKVVDEVKKKEEEIQNNNNAIKDEEAKREKIHEDADTKRNTEENLTDFFNARPNGPK